MRTYKYRFPAYGDIGTDKEEMAAYISKLEDNLKDSPDCLGTYVMFDTHSAILDRVTVDMDETTGKITALSLHTYTKLWEDREDDLRQCVEENLASTSQECFPGQPKGIITEGDVEDLGLESVIPTYRYRFPAEGKADLMPAFTETYLEKRLKDSPECLMAYCIFPTDSEILDRVTFDIKDNTIRAVDLHTYTKLWDGQEEDFKDCVQENLNVVMQENGVPRDEYIKITGPVEAYGREGDIPVKLYHIAEKNDLDNIMDKGLIPMTGSNNYKSTEDYVYLCSEKDLAPWFAVLKHKESPVILEIQTATLTGIEPGRMFNDRRYVQGGYGEYRTKETIPPSVIRETDMRKGLEFSTRLRGNMISQLERSITKDEIAETSVGLKRMVDLGIMKEEQVNARVKTHEELLEQAGPENIGKCYEEEEDFAQAIGQIPVTDTDMELPFT